MVSLIDAAHMPVMSCLEHTLLTSADFTQPQDFDYLLHKDYPCFKVVYQAGQPCLLVRHYLAKLLLPSGISIEILPKISVKAGNSQSYRHNTAQQIAAARHWVAQMLLDIAEQHLAKPLSAIGLEASLEASIEAIATVEHPAISHLSQQAQQQIGESPWYLWLLNMASEKVSAAVKVLPNRYAKQAYNRPQAQGKINIAAQLKNNWHRPHYLYSEQAVLQSDGLIEQFLATGWQQLQILLQGASATHSPFTKTPLVATVFAQVATLPKPQWQPVSQQLKRRQATWQGQLTAQQRQTLHAAILWCDWVLNDLTLWADNLIKDGNLASTGLVTHERATSTIASPALMINMNHAFEQWVIGRLKLGLQATHPTSTLLLQPRLDWLATTGATGATGAGRANRGLATFEDTLTHTPTHTPPHLQPHLQVVQQLIPDVCVQSATGAITHVIDIKYKSIQTMADINSRDWQQLFAYQQRLQAPEAWLIYPMSATFTQKQTVTIQQSLPAVVAPSLDAPSIGIPYTTMSAVPFDIRQRKILLSAD